MAQNFWYPPGSASAGSVIANQGTPNNDANAWPVRITDGTHDATVTAGGALNVSIASGLANPLPVQDAPAEASLASIDGKVSTSALQTAGNASLSSIDSKLNSLGQKAMTASVPVVIASDQSTIPVSAASLPLPSGAATSALQTALNNKTASAFINSPFDETVITYVGATTNIATVVYKLASVTVNTLTMTYDGSNRLIDVVKT